MSRLLQVIFCLVSVITLSIPVLSQPSNSVLAEGTWYKLAVAEEGIYKIDRKFLSDIGIDASSIDPRNIKIYGNGGGMLPQANNAPRLTDLVENSIWVNGESDGKFDNGDYVIFYAQGPDQYHYDESGTLIYERNIYSDLNFYFLTIGNDAGQRVKAQQDLGSDFQKIRRYNAISWFEKEAYNLLKSGREWYTDKFDVQTEKTYDFSFPGLMAGTEITITSSVMAQSFAQSTFKLSINGVALGEQNIAPVPDFREGAYRYSVKGRNDESTYTINSNQLSGNNQLSVTVAYEKNSSGRSIGYLNYLKLEAICELRLNDKYTIFRSLESLNNTNSAFEVKGVNDQVKIWDITSPLAPLNQQYSLSNGTASFGSSTTQLHSFVVFDPSKVITPIFAGEIASQNLRGMTTPDLLIVSHPDLLPEAKRLANFRSSNDNMTARVVTTQQVYNEFSSGKQDVTAIRDLAKHLFTKSDRLKYLLLFGKGSYDYKDILKNNTNLVPIYESRNSLHPLETYGSDDFYGFLEDDEGEWLEEPGGNHTLEIGIGRLPVTSLQQAKDMVDKLISYSTGTKNFGPWRNEVVFVADDGDNNIHIKQSDQLAVLIDTAFTSFNYNKLYLDAFPQISTPNGETSPKAREALDQAVEKGALVVNFTGHGGELGWMQERVLTLFMIEGWKNIRKLPLFVTATCEFGRHDDPQLASGGEMVVTHPNGGGIAIISTCRPVYSSSNFELNKAFYDEAFRKEGDSYLRLGDILRITKNNSIDKAIDYNQVGNRNFALLGDPSLKLNYPEKQIAIKSINDNSNKTDTLKALSLVTITGEVQNSNKSIDSHFDGELEVIVFDKESTLSTLGNQSSPYSYSSRENALFRGKSTISNGQFEVKFIVPKNMSYKPGKGKISLYAVDDDKKTDANGADIDVVFGGSATDVEQDNTGPKIKLYLGDTTYTGSGEVGANTLLVAKLYDESGINISQYGVGNNITATLDNETTFVLNDYYTASKDSYKEGLLLFPLNGLKKGKHTIQLKAWDTHNNSGEAVIEFTVADPNGLFITNFINSPNPFFDNTTLTFEHTRVGEDLEINLQIISRHAEVVEDIDFQVDESTARVNLFEWDGTNSSGKKLNAGIYIFKLSVRSMADGAKNQKYQKVIIIN
ncbi:hypothetical protein C900_01813 [Fulvivirga imtechensis AK7]|uniref:Gingipain domain-containing protein n=1 Tax=Fulvivirga imtechensis AK7 TaxID=1237149 RepID=L8JXC7_9BACT|nr:type IX secretion system sortase PorU [Fulvivirga imtechensis]ELR72259.1 hypothetical protein C900_01813 [Fulvivirga imtechensis AK7]